MSSVVHAMGEKRSWWDGHVVSMCGRRFESPGIRECWVKGGVTCPGCKQAMKKERRKK